MIVIDASAAVEALTATAPSTALLDMLVDDIHAPHHLDVEVLSALRSLERGGLLTTSEAEQARADFTDFSIVRHDILTLADRAWHLRRHYTAYDACYLALSEALDAPLVTCDRKLDAGGHHAAVRVMTSPGGAEGRFAGR